MDIERLPQLLEQYEFATLQTLASSLGLKIQGRLSKSMLIETLAQRMCEPERVARQVAGLSQAEREIIILIQRQGGKATRGAIRRRLHDLNWLDARENRQDAYSNQQPDHRKPDSRFMDEMLAHLVSVGLVFGIKAPDAWGRVVNLTFRLVNDYQIPPEIMALLPPPPQLPDRLPALAEPERIVESSARIFQRDLYLYWSYLYHNRVDLLSKNALPKRHLTAINETLLQRESIGTGEGEADFPRLIFLRAMLVQMNLAQVEDGRLIANPGDAFFGASPLERIRRSYEAFLANRNFNELMMAFAITATQGTRLIPVPDLLLQARQHVTSFLALSEGWTGLSALIERIRTVQYEFLLPRTFRAAVSNSYYYPAGSPYSVYGNALGWEWPFPPSMDEGEGWRRVEGAFIADLIGGPLHWLGLVDLAFRGTEGGPEGYRLSVPGRWLLAGGPPPEIPTGGGQVIVQPDFTILAFDPVSDAVLFHLEHFAQRVSAERAILLRLTQSSVYAAQQSGWDAGRIQAYLEDLSHQPLPGNIARTLAEWQKIHERIRVYPHVHLLHARQPSDLEELAALKPLQPLLKDTLAPGVVALSQSTKLADVFEQLARAGWRPTLTTKGAGVPAYSVKASADGQLRCVHHAPGLYLRAHLARFAEEDGEGYRLTPESIRRAVNAGVDAKTILVELNRVTVEPLPDVLEQRILAWSGVFGQVQLEPARLLRFKNNDALAHLLADPEIAGLLRKLRPADLEEAALVRAKDLEKLHRLLDERGVEWKE